MKKTTKLLCITKNKTELNWNELWKLDLAKCAEVHFIGRGYPECASIENRIKELGINCLLVCGLPKDCLYRDLSKLDIFKVNVLFDYNIFQDGSTYNEYDKFLQNNNFDLLFAHSNLVLNRLSSKYNVKLTKLSVSPSLSDLQVRDIDVMSSGSTNERFYQKRKEVNRFLKGIKQLTVLTKRLKFENYITYLNKSKIFVGCGNNFMNDCVSIKYLECMISGTLFITTMPINLDEYGFVDGKHLIIYNDFNDLKEKVLYYLDHEYERQEIIKTSMEYVYDNFTNGIVLKGMLKDINGE